MDKEKALELALAQIEKAIWKRFNNETWRKSKIEY